MKLYWTSVEFDIINPPEYENCIGGFVYLFLKARDVKNAIPKIEKTLEEEGLKVNTIEFISQYENIPWDEPEDQLKYDALAAKAENSNEIVWDEISAYEFKEE